MDNTNPLKDLTVLLVLKDRLQFTERWIDYNLQANPGYQIIVADGGIMPINNSFILEGLQKLNASYIYCGQDYDLSKMTQKIYFALTKCKTKYVMLASNDDFYIAKGLSISLKFLEENLDYISCSGKIQNFSLLPHRRDKTPYAGEVFFGDELYPGNGIHGGTPKVRAQEFLRQDESFWHSIFRRQNLIDCYKLAKNQKNEDFTLYDLFVNVHLALQGKHGRLRNSFSMLHQVHDEMEARNLVLKSNQALDWWEKADSLISVALAAFSETDYSKSLINEFERIHNFETQSNSVRTKWKLRSIVQKLKYKFYKSSIKKFLDYLDPLTHSLIRDSEVRKIQKYLLHYDGFKSDILKQI